VVKYLSVGQKPPLVRSVLEGGNGALKQERQRSDHP
jgi:hypothetical protein